jgi:hypothetical protein
MSWLGTGTPCVGVQQVKWAATYITNEIFEIKGT